MDSVALLRDPRLWKIFLLGVASGYPWLLIGSTMTAWLTDEGLSRSSIGFFGIIFVAYTINFLWAPIVDHFRLPGIGRLGQRRSWILLCQYAMIALCVLLALTGPSTSLLLTAIIAFGIAVSSATQDLAIDAYRITIIEEHETSLIGHGAAMATCGWWTGLSAPGAVAFWLADPLGWPMVFGGMALLLAVISLFVFFLFDEPTRPTTATAPQGIVSWIDRSYVNAVAEFFTRNGVRIALGLLAFIFLFKIGEAFLGRMVIVFYKEVGFTDAQIGTYSKAYGLVVTIICSIMAGVLAGRFGPVKGLFIAGIAMATTNLLFSWIALQGPDTSLLLFAVVADGITAAFSTVAFVTFISYYTSRLHTATQYGALASLGNSSRTLIAATSGLLVDSLGGDWALFFVLTALMVLPSLAILLWIARLQRQPQTAGTT